MATNLATTVGIELLANFRDLGIDLSTPSDRLSYSFADALTDGDGDDEADIVWHDQRTLLSTSESLELAAAAEGDRLVGGFGNKIVFAKIKGLLIENLETTAGYDLAIGGAGADAWETWVAAAGDIVVIGPQGVLLLWAPGAAYVVAADELLKIDAGANDVNYKIILIGVSA